MVYGDVVMLVKVMKNGVLDFMFKLFCDQDMLDVVQNVLLKDEKCCKLDGCFVDVCCCYGMLMLCECEVMKYVVSGLLNKQIVVEMGFSEIIVKIYCGYVMCKMGV